MSGVTATYLIFQGHAYGLGVGCLIHTHPNGLLPVDDGRGL